MAAAKRESKVPPGLRRTRAERDWKSDFQLLVAMVLGGASMPAVLRNALLAMFERWPDAAALSTANVTTVTKVLREGGLEKEQAEIAIALAADLQARFGGQVPQNIDEMVSIPGVQRGVANVVVRRAFGVVAGAAPIEVEEPVPSSALDHSRLPANWEAALGEAYPKLDIPGVIERVAGERAVGAVFPPAWETFAAYHHTPFANTRVLILGQDPYPTPGLAHGLAFSVKPGIKMPQSLVNMFQELHDDVGCPMPTSGYLLPWARQGVLLLNSILTVRASEPGSHKLFGWRELTNEVIRALDAREEHVVFVFWGGYARAHAKLVTSGRHTIIEGAHPSPMSVKAWRGSRPYSKINAALRAHGQPEIDWTLP